MTPFQHYAWSVVLAIACYLFFLVYANFKKKNYARAILILTDEGKLEIRIENYGWEIRNDNYKDTIDIRK
jgi:hypothetical protein